MDMQAFISVIMPHMIRQSTLGATLAGEPAKDLDVDELNTELGRLPDKPDENLH